MHEPSRRETESNTLLGQAVWSVILLLLIYAPLALSGFGVSGFPNFLPAFQGLTALAGVYKIYAIAMMALVTFMSFAISMFLNRNAEREQSSWLIATFGLLSLVALLATAFLPLKGAFLIAATILMSLNLIALILLPVVLNQFSQSLNNDVKAKPSVDPGAVRLTVMWTAIVLSGLALPLILGFEQMISAALVFMGGGLLYCVFRSGGGGGNALAGVVAIGIVLLVAGGILAGAYYFMSPLFKAMLSGRGLTLGMGITPIATVVSLCMLTFFLMGSALARPDSTTKKTGYYFLFLGTMTLAFLAFVAHSPTSPLVPIFTIGLLGITLVSGIIAASILGYYAFAEPPVPDYQPPLEKAGDKLDVANIDDGLTKKPNIQPPPGTYQQLPPAPSAPPLNQEPQILEKKLEDANMEIERLRAQLAQQPQAAAPNDSLPPPAYDGGSGGAMAAAQQQRDDGGAMAAQQREQQRARSQPPRRYESSGGGDNGDFVDGVVDGVACGALMACCCRLQ